jgi:formate dehydrogenase assembly factor FdhD
MTGWKNWAVGEVVTEPDFQSYVQDQVVQVYAGSSARATALGTAVAEGMVSYLEDVNAVEVYDGSAWVSIATGDITAVTAGTGLTGGGTSGSVTLNANYAAIGSGITITSSQVSDIATNYVNRTNGAVTTAAVGSAVVRNISLGTVAPGTAIGMDGDVFLVYTP